MTIFTIPEGKVVDRIELAAGDGMATLNVIYKEDRPKKNKPVAVLCETDAHTCLYRDKRTEKIVMFRPDHYKPDTARYVPVRSAKAGEFVVLSHDACQEALRELSELCAILRSIENGNVTTEETFRQIDILSRRARALQVVLATQGQ